MSTVEDEEPSTHVLVDPPILYVGTPVILLSTLNEDGSANLAPASSYWALGRIVVLGVETDGQTATNLLARPEITINIVDEHLWQNVESLSTVTGKNPVPRSKASHYSFEPHKFERAGLHAEPSVQVGPPRVSECGLQLEAQVARITEGVTSDYLIVEAHVVQVHARRELVVPGTEHINAHAWHPLIYSFRHYFGLGTEQGWTGKSPTPHYGA